MGTGRYERALEALNETGNYTMKVFGQSMRPIIESGSKLTFTKTDDDYRVGDVVFCRVKGRYIDAHLITKVAADGRFMISNNHGHHNGWTRTIYGRVTAMNDEPFGRRV